MVQQSTLRFGVLIGILTKDIAALKNHQVFFATKANLNSDIKMTPYNKQIISCGLWIEHRTNIQI